MRLLIECSLENKEEISIPVDYRRKVLSFFKSVLEKNSLELKDKYYKENNLKDFTYSCYLPIKEIKDKKIYLSSNTFKIFFSTSEYNIFFDFYNSFQKSLLKDFNFAGYILNINSLTLVKEKKITTEEVVFKIISPIIVRDHNKENGKNWFYSLNETEGVEILKRNITSLLKDKFEKNDIDELEITPINIKKVISYYYNFKMEGNKGLIKIKAKKEILDYLYKAGFSSNRSAGYGYVDVV
ncbi:CRISPR-associated endoribonuclease Cas6 [Fusobacterium russii]|uniref:CRISPR-associated endoribonuclease Cas6 n=1 Tax=Fusobacterium russii TaxID=854 RepID=UPI000399A7CD|nr:CRISPR-associated endoribonuclease Cas6 [Fusobacterium russii]